MATASDLINGALRLIGQLAEGETPSPETSSDSLDALNDMLQSMNNELGMVYQIQTEVFSWGAGVTSRTIGTTGNFVTSWPIAVEDTTFFRDTSVTPNLDSPVSIIGEQQFRALALKDFEAYVPTWLFYDRAYPDGTLYAWPVPGVALELHLSTRKQLSTLATLATSVTLPPGYRRLIRFNLAVELAPEFGVEAPPSVQRIATKSRSIIATSNKQDLVMGMPNGLNRQFGASLADFYAGGSR